MRRLNQRGLMAGVALESEEVAAAAPVAAVETPAADTPAVDTPAADPVVDEAPVAIPDTADTVETNLLEVNGAEAEAAEVAEQTEQAVEVVAALEALHTCLGASAQNGGLPREAAAAIHVAVEHMCNQVGMPAPMRKTMPSLESYGGTSSRVAATQLAMETLAETAAKIWAAIVEALKKSIAWLQERFQLVFGTAGKIKARAEELAKAAGQVQGEARNAEIEDARVLKAIAMGGKADGVLAGADKIAKAAETVFKPAVERIKLMEKIVESETLTDAALFVGKLNPEPGIHYAVVANPEQEGLGKLAEGMVMTRSEELPGGKAVMVVYPAGDPKELDDIVRGITHAAVSVGQGYQHEIAEGAKLKTLSAADAEQLASIAAHIAEVVEKFQGGVKEVSEAKKNVLAKAEALAKTEGDDESAQTKRALGKIVASTGKLVDAPISGFSVYALNTAKALLDYVGLSLKQYGPEPKTVGDHVKEGAEKVKEAATDAVDKTKEAAGKAADAVKDAAAAVKDKVAGDDKSAAA